MQKEKRTIIYDQDLKIEAYHFSGIIQPFVNHFHEYYVIGYLKSGQRFLTCKNNEYLLKTNSIVIFNPGDNHACKQIDNSYFDYYSLNISKEVIYALTKKLTGKQYLPIFSNNVIYDQNLTTTLVYLYELIFNQDTSNNKQMVFFNLIDQLLQNNQIMQGMSKNESPQIEQACKFIDQHYNKHLYLQQICQYTNVSKSTLIRSFTKTKGITPYRYLESKRINEAKKLLEKNLSILDTALQTGFFDQSHFTNSFIKMIGLAPGYYQKIRLQTKEDHNEK